MIRTPTSSNAEALILKETCSSPEFCLQSSRVTLCHCEICLGRMAALSYLVVLRLTASVQGGQLLCPEFLLQGPELQMSDKLHFVLDNGQRIKLMWRRESSRLPELQSSPAKPSWQTQKPSLQTPFLLQLLAQYTSEQSSPTYPGRHWHVPLLHSPWSEQSLRHLPTMQSSPVKDSSHTHSPSMHRPRPEQSEGHRGSEQLSPAKSRSHTHSPSMHTPWPEQSSRQRGSEQFLPLQPSSQMQPHKSKLKLPWPLQPGTKSRRPGRKAQVSGKIIQRQKQSPTQSSFKEYNTTLGYNTFSSFSKKTIIINSE